MSQSSNKDGRFMEPLPEKIYDFTITIGVKAPSEEIARFKLQEHTRYMTLIHTNSFIDVKLDVCVEREIIPPPPQVPYNADPSAAARD